MADQRVKKEINRIKALVESAEGPVRKDLSAVPIADAMSAGLTVARQRYPPPRRLRRRGFTPSPQHISTGIFGAHLGSV